MLQSQILRSTVHVLESKVGNWRVQGGPLHCDRMSLPVRRYVQCNTAPALESLEKTHPGWPVLITGHSMGGEAAEAHRRCHNSL